MPFFCIHKYQERCYACTTYRASKSLCCPLIWILSGYCYPTAIPAKFGWGRVRVKHSNILIVICTYCKCLNALFCVNLPLFCKVDKASIIFFLELHAIYRVIVYQIFKKLKGEIKQFSQQSSDSRYPAIKTPMH